MRIEPDELRRLERRYVLRSSTTFFIHKFHLQLLSSSCLRVLRYVRNLTPKPDFDRRGAAAMAPTPRTSVTSRPSSAKEASKKNDDADETPAYSQEHVQLNTRIIYYSRTFLSIVGGVTAGVLGLTGISGFLCYFLIMALASVGIAAKAKFDVLSYFDSWNRVLFDGIGQGLLSFILFWTFAYDLVHIF